MRGASFLACVTLFTAVFFFAGSRARANDLSADDIKAFRSWIVTIVEDLITRGPNPRWNHQDCAGLVRFAVKESMATHDQGWRKSNGFLGRPLPPEIEMSQESRKTLAQWKSSDDSKSQFVRALPLIQQNTVFIGKTIDRIEPGDLLFFDQGEEQHVMVWTGRRIVYHNGRLLKPGEKSADNGLRAVSLRDLSQWRDTRWQPKIENPNFVGFYRLRFLTQGSL